MSEYINNEFNKIRHSFSRVKDDLLHLSSQIHDAYDEMMKKHELLRSEVSFLSSQIKGHAQSLHVQRDTLSKTQMEFLKTTIRDLKKEISDLHKMHSHFSIDLQDMKKRKVESRELNGIHEKIHTTETEVFLLKERMLEKDIELKKLKEMNKKLFELVEDLTKAELHMVEASEKKVTVSS